MKWRTVVLDVLHALPLLLKSARSFGKGKRRNIQSRKQRMEHNNKIIDDLLKEQDK